ncbi:hypothetical protein FRC11_004447, partial [Ceratobasidium sp. 423]
MSTDPPAPETTNTQFRHWITDIEVSPGNTDPNCKFSARMFLDDELVCKLPWIDHTRPPRWSGLLSCGVTPSSKFALRLCKNVNGKSRYFNFPPFTVTEVDEESGGVTLELDEAAWVVTIKYLTPATAEQLFPNELGKFNAIKGTYNSLEPDATVKYLFKNAIQFAIIAAELLDQQTQFDDTVRDILRGLARIRDIVDTMNQASSSMLATSVNQSMEPIEGILALLEDVSVYIVNQYTTNCLANISRDDSQPNEAYDTEAYQTRLEDLQKSFYASWSPAATSSMDSTYPSTAEAESLEIPLQGEHIPIDEQVKRADPYEMLNLLRPMDPSGYDPDQTCLDGTREAVLNKIITWSQNRDNGQNLLWISGPAGMGKSSVATSICQRLHAIRALAGSFFCHHDDPDSSNPLRLINNLVYTMAVRLPSYAHEVADAIRLDRTICTSHLSLRYEHLVRRPLERLKSMSTPTTLIVVVDGLDECGDRDSREKLLDKLYNLSKLVPWLKVIISARPLGDIQEYFQIHCPHEPIIHLEAYDASDDIRIYIQGQLGQLARKENWPRDSFDRLCTMAEGVFLWATLATKYIKKSIFPGLPRLHTILNNQKSPLTDRFHALYTRALKVATNDNDDGIKDAHLRCMGAILATSEREPPDIPGLQYLLLITSQVDQLTFERILKNLAPLLLVLDGGRIKLLHRSLKDFITDSSCSGEFYIPIEQCEAGPAVCCLEVMQRELRFNICELETSHLLNSEVPDLKHRIQSHIEPGLKYACIHWIDHFISSLNETLVGAVKTFLEGPQLMYWIEVLSLLDRLDVAIVGLSKLSSPELTQFDDWSFIASWAKDAHCFLLSFYDPIASSTPHLYISALAFSPSKSLTVERMRPYFPNTITIGGRGSTWHPCVKSILHPQAIQSLSISPNGLTIVVGYPDGSLALWDLQTGTRITDSGSVVGHKDLITCVAFSPNSDLIASGSYDMTIRVWDVAGCLQASTVLTGHSGPVYAVTFSPDATIIASGSSDKTIRLWDSNTMRPIHGPYGGHSSRVSSVAFSPDGTKLVSGSWDKTIRVWVVDIGSQRLADNPLVITGNSDSITCVALSPNGSMVVSGSTDRTIQAWDTRTGQKAESCTSPAKHSDSVTSISFSPNGDHIISTSLDGAIQLHNSMTLVPISHPFGHSSSVNAVAFSPNSAYIVSGSTDMTTRVWEISACPKPMTAAPIVGHSNSVSCVAVSSDGTHIISGSYDNSIRMWDAQTGAPIGDPFIGHSNCVNSVAISPDGTRIISGSDDSSMKLWDTTTRAAILSYQHSHAIWCTEFSPNGALIAFGSDDSKAYLWDPTHWTMIGNALQAHSRKVLSVAFSPDGTCLASASADHTVILWDTQTHNRLGNPLSGHTDYVRSVAFSPYGTRLVSGSDDKTVRLWDRQTGNTIYTFTGHTHFVYAVVFSPDGSAIASGSYDNSMRLWNAKTGQPIQQPFTGHSGCVYAITFSHDGNYVISGSGDKTIRARGIDTLSPVVEQTNGTPGTYCWPTNPYELASHPHHPGWVTHDQHSLVFWLPPYYQQPEQFPSTHSVVSCPRAFNYSKFVHGTAWAAVASDSDRGSG